DLGDPDAQRERRATRSRCLHPRACSRALCRDPRGDRAPARPSVSSPHRSRDPHAVVHRSVRGLQRCRVVGGLVMRPLRTYALVRPAGVAPTEYEIVASRLHAYVGRGFEVAVPLAAWYERNQTRSPLAAPDWDGFVDPRETTYTKYTRLQRD